MMKYIIVMMMCALPWSAYAGSKGLACEKLEYAELKDMGKDQLAILFCSYQRRTTANQEMISKYQDFSMMEAAEACLDQQMRLSEIYKQKFGEYPSECSH